MGKKKFKCPYTFPHKSRKAKVDYITDIGGYYSRDGRFPIEFNVAAYGADTDFDSLWTTALESGEISPDTDKQALKDAAALVYKESGHLFWDWGLEDARRGLEETDAYKMLWDGKDTLKVEFGLYGRQGKHLCIEEFEGLTLKGLSEDELAEKLMHQSGDSKDGWDEVVDEPKLRRGWDWTISNEDVDTLYRYIRQCEVDFTPEKAGKEVQYQAAWQLLRLAEEKLEELTKLRADRESLVGAAKTVAEAIDQDDAKLMLAFATLLRAATLDIAEILPPD